MIFQRKISWAPRPCGYACAAKDLGEHRTKPVAVHETFELGKAVGMMNDG